MCVRAHTQPDDIKMYRVAFTKKFMKLALFLIISAPPICHMLISTSRTRMKLIVWFSMLKTTIDMLIKHALYGKKPDLGCLEHLFEESLELINVNNHNGVQL